MIDAKAIPDALKEGEGWQVLDLDPDWVWTVRDEREEIVGVLIAAPCHGLVFVWRIKVLPTAPPWSLGRLLRTFIRDIRRRGCLGYMAMLDVCQQPREKQLWRIAGKAGAITVTAATLVCGSVNARHVGGK